MRQGRCSDAASPSEAPTLGLMPLLRGPYDLAGLRLGSGAGASIGFEVPAPAFELGGNAYSSQPDPLPVRLEVSRTVGEGWAFRIRFEADVRGPCTRCLADAGAKLPVEAREASRPGGGEELECPYLEDELLDLTAWVRDSLMLALPPSILCAADCPGLCPECGGRMAELGPEHRHERPPDPRWDALRRLGQ